jgi:hypothetical protein
MPLDLASSTENVAEQVDDQDFETEIETLNPLAVSGRVMALAELIARVTEGNTRTLSADEFQDLAEAYDELDEFECLGLRTELARRNIYWTSTLEDPCDGYADTGYEAYQRLSAVTTT